MYLSLGEITQYESDIRAEFEALLNNRWFSARRNSKQWAFLRHCFQLLIKDITTEFECSKNQATQYKFEINDRLLRYYLSPTTPVKFVFSLVHQNITSSFEDSEENYPYCNGYSLRVSYNQIKFDELQQRRFLIPKTIAEAIDAEFAVYQKVPLLNFSQLKEVFDENSSAYKVIYNKAHKRKSQRWTLQNPFNPSTKRLINIKIKKFESEIAEVRTKEYWLVMWWSESTQQYEYIYSEENHQTYILTWKKDKWVVLENERQQPKTSVRYRQSKTNRER